MTREQILTALDELRDEVSRLPESFHEGRVLIPMGDVLELIEQWRDEVAKEAEP